MQGTLPFTLFILTLSQSLPVYSHTIRLFAYLFSHSRCMSILTRSGSLPVYSLTLVACLFSHDQALCLSILSLSLHVYFLTLRITAYVFCTIRLTAVYSLTVRLAACLVLHYQAHILSLSGLLHVYSHSQAYCHLFSHSHSGSLPVYSHTIGILPVYSHSHSGSLPVYSLTQACCLSILIPADSPPTYSHTIRLTASVHSQTHCHPILHYQTCLPNLALTPRAYLFLHTLSGLLPMYSQAHCLCILRLTAYVVSGSLPM